jgi:hypothetical protein
LKHDQYTIRYGDKGTKKVGKNLQAVLDIYNDLYHLEPLGHPIRFHHPSPKLHKVGWKDSEHRRVVVKVYLDQVSASSTCPIKQLCQISSIDRSSILHKYLGKSGVVYGSGGVMFDRKFCLTKVKNSDQDSSLRKY